jgi:tetratricopeptide (TPR) repeat protein
MPLFSRLALLTLLACPSVAATDSRSLPRAIQDIARQAEQAQSSDHLPDAIKLYQKGLALDAKWNQGWWALGSILYDQDRFPEAQTAFRHFVTLSPNPGPGYAFLALCEYETGAYDNSLQHFRRWASNGWTGTPQLIDVGVFHFALLLTHEGSFIPALYLLSAEVEKSYSGPSLIEAMGLASLRMQNVPEEYPPERREAVWLAGEAAYYTSLHPADFVHANEFGDRLAAHYDQTPNVHYFLGTLRKFQSDDAGATKEYERELQISPKNAAAMIELARLATDDDRMEQALTLAKQATALDPNNPEAHSVYGEVLLHFGKAQQSVGELELAKRLAPDSATVRFQLAAAYRKLHRTVDADRETKAFNLLKDKQQVIASPQEKLHSAPELLK